MRKSKRIVALLVSLIMAVGAFTACNETPADTSSQSGTSSATSDTASSDGSGEGTVDKTQISGHVRLASESWLVDGDQKLIAEFNKLYPNIEVEVVTIPDGGDRNDYMTAQAAAKDLPDLVRSLWYDLPPDVSQGWLYPLNEFVDADDEYQYVEPSLMEPFYYNGRLYGLPLYLGYTAMVVNLDMLESMNEDIPSYEEWTIDEFTRLVKKATTNTTSGITHVWNLDYFLPAQMNADLVDGCLNPTTGKVDLTGGDWIRAVNLVKELKSVPGLISDELWNQEIRDAGGVDDYEKKFGKDADALQSGKVLVAFASSWDYGTIKTLPFNWDYYPLPFDESVGFRSHAHTDLAMMTATAENPEAAFEYLKYMTYGKDGCLARLDIAKNTVDAEGNPAPDLFLPATNHPEVAAAMAEVDYMPAGLLYMYNNMDRSIHGDHYRFVPNFNTATGSMQGEERQQIYDGVVEAAAVAAEMEEKINEMLKEANDEFLASLPAVEAEFDANHSK